MANRRDLRTIFGFPFAPPPLLTRAVVRVRRGLGRAQREAAPPSIRVLEGLFGLFDNRVLGLLVELDLPDLLHRPRSTIELASATGASPDPLARLLRYASGRGFVGCDRRGRWRASPVTEVLRRDHPNSWRGWVEVAGSDWFWDACRNAHVPLLGEGSGVAAATGVDFFEFLGRVRPDAGDAFNRAMAAVSTVQALALSEALDWSGIRTVCDVGGGTGAALEYLLSTRADLDGILFDLPEVVSHARPRLKSRPLADRCRLERGDFFQHVPAGADLYLLLAIIHDWDDARATRILTHVREVLGATGRAVVVESELAERPRGEFVEASDLLVLVLLTGRERTGPQFHQLFSDSGLRIESRVPLMTGFTAFVLAPDER